MSLFHCLETAINYVDDDGNKIIDSERARQAQAMFNELRTKYGKEMEPNAADELAARDTKKAMREKVDRRRHPLTAQIRAQRRLHSNVTNHVNRKGAADAAEALPQLIQNTGTARFENVRDTKQAVEKMLFRRLNGFMAAHSKNLAGQTRAKVQLKNVRREALGETTGDQNAVVFARALKDAFEDARRMFNAEGGHIAKFDNWLPQVWNKRSLSAVSADQFADDLMDQLDWSRIENPLTNRPFGEGNGSRDFLINAYEGLTGTRAAEPTFQGGGKSLANRRADQRVLHFKNADAWESVAQKYGNPDLFDASVSYLSNMARDISMMKVLGPNPKAGLDFAINVAEEQAKTLGEKAGRRVTKKANLSRNMLGLFDGTHSEPVNQAMASFFAGTRDVLSSAYLGSALISSISDVATMSFGAKYVGLGHAQTLNRTIKNLTSNASRADLERTVGVLDTMLNTSAAMARYMGDITGPEITRRLSTGVIRAQGLAHWTDINRASFQMEFMGLLAANKGKSFDRLPKELKRTLEKSGFDKAEWNTIRATDLFDGNTGKFLVPDDIRHRTDIPQSEAEGLAIRLQSTIERELEFVVPSKDLVGEATVLGSTRPGEIGGELLRGALQFKAFGVSLLLNQIRRTMEIETIPGRIGYVAQVVSAMTVLGAVAMSLKDTLKGRDPRSPDSAGYWAAAAAQGGGFGILGDLLFQDQNRYGGGPVSTVLGPQANLTDRMLKLTAGNVQQALQGEDTELSSELFKMVKDHMPGGSLWYARLPFERMVFDQLQKMVDPEASADFRKAEKRLRRDYDTRSFWPKGDLTPERGPSLPQF